MQYTESTFIDRAKAGWSSGPWDNEPDVAEWDDRVTGYRCIALRNKVLGNWCGYVRVPDGHVASGIPHNKLNLDVHGGITISGFNLTNGWINSGQWTFMFDCAHDCDVTPLMKEGEASYVQAYRRLTYVRSECFSLAKQLKAIDDTDRK